MSSRPNFVCIRRIPETEVNGRQGHKVQITYEVDDAWLATDSELVEDGIDVLAGVLAAGLDGGPDDADESESSTNCTLNFSPPSPSADLTHLAISNVTLRFSARSPQTQETPSSPLAFGAVASPPALRLHHVHHAASNGGSAERRVGSRLSRLPCVLHSSSDEMRYPGIASLRTLTKRFTTKRTR